MGKGSSSSTTVDPVVSGLHQEIYDLAEPLATSMMENPSSWVAPLSSQQTAAANLATTNANTNYNTGSGTATALQSYQPGSLATTNMSAYMNPYTQNVVDTTLAQLAKSNAEALQGIDASAVQTGSGGTAYGGGRQGVLQANQLENYGDTVASTVANLYNTGYNTALTSAQNDINTGLSGAQLNLSAANQALQSALGSQKIASNQYDLLDRAGSMMQGQAQDIIDVPISGISLLNSTISGFPTGSTTTTDSSF